jgi:integrase
MRNLAAGESLNEHGICYTKLPNNDGNFSINIMVDGKRIHRALGKESNGVTIQQAQDVITTLRTQARERRLKLPKGKKIFMGFSDAAKSYLERLYQENGKDIEAKKRQIELHLEPFFKDCPLTDIQTADVERYKAHRLATGNIKKASINRELAVLSHLYTKAIDWGWVDNKPFRVKKFQEEPTRLVYLSQEQILKLLEAAKADSCPDIYLFCIIGLATSMRLSEILSIRLEDINIEQRWIYIPRAKAGARQQPITPDLADYLAGYLKTKPLQQIWLFPSKHSQSGHRVEIKKSFRRVVKAAGLDPKEVVRHTLRHTAITHLVQAGIDLPTVQRISGHKTMQMVVRYSHQNGDHIRMAMDTLQQRYKATQPKQTA